MLSGILNLSEAQVGAVYALYRQFRRDWLAKFLDDPWIDAYGGVRPRYRQGGDAACKALADDLGQSYQTLAALRRRFERMRTLRLPEAQGAGRFGGPHHAAT